MIMEFVTNIASKTDSIMPFSTTNIGHIEKNVYIPLHQLEYRTKCTLDLRVS